MEAINSCRFCGRLKTYSASKVGDSSLLLGKGVLFLPDPNNTRIGQNINFIAWEELAERLGEVNIGDWITILTSYMPSMFRGQLQDTFNAVSVIRHE